MIDWRFHLRERWPRLNRTLIEQATSVGRAQQVFLADLALRGGVFSEREASDLYQAGVNEGMRRLALETIKLCKSDPNLLLAMIEQPAVRKPGEAR